MRRHLRRYCWRVAPPRFLAVPISSPGTGVTAALPISLEVNGESVDANVLPRLNLADFLREHLKLTGTHVGCEHGVCGACTVRVNGEIVRSCLMLAVQTHGASVVTIEGLSDSGEIADLQAAFSRPQRIAMRLLHAGNACCRTGFAAAGNRAGSGADTRASVRQLLPLYRLSRHYRRGRDHGAGPNGTQAMKVASTNPDGLTVLDRPNSYIGKVVPRPNLERLMQGRGLYVSDMELPRMAHVVFLRSPPCPCEDHCHRRRRSAAYARSDRCRDRQRACGRRTHRGLACCHI